MPRKIPALLAFLLAALLAVPASADLATPADEDAAFDGTTSAPVDPGTEDNNTGGLAAAVPTTMFSCANRTYEYANLNLRVGLKTCIQRRDDTGEKRTRTSVACRVRSNGSPTTCHFWWSQDPRGNAPYRNYYTNVNGVWVITSTRAGQTPCLNCIGSVGYSLWAPNQHLMYVYGRSALGITLHGGVYGWPYVKSSAVLLDG